MSKREKIYYDHFDPKKWKNENDVIYDVAKRAKQLGELPIRELRILAGYGYDTESESIRANQHHSRGELIEIILTEELIQEYPRELAEE